MKTFRNIVQVGQDCVSLAKAKVLDIPKSCTTLNYLTIDRFSKKKKKDGLFVTWTQPRGNRVHEHRTYTEFGFSRDKEILQTSTENLMLGHEICP